MWDGAGGPLEAWEDGKYYGELKRPFPHRAAWTPPDDYLEPPEHFEDDEAEERWHAEADGILYAPELTNGAIPICHHGCALRDWLVLTGPQAGKVWHDRRADFGGLEPVGLGFADWYQQWLLES
jgi:hypothetical protein